MFILNKLHFIVDVNFKKIVKARPRGEGVKKIYSK